MDTFEFLGIWWLPSSPDRRIGGVLSFTEDKGLQLRLSGVLDDYLEKWEDGEITKLFGGRQKNYDIINGITVEQKKISLIDSKHLGYQGGVPPGLTAETVYSRFCFIGNHFNTIDEIKFNKLNLKYTDLSEWLSTTGYTIKLPTKNKSGKFFENYEIRYNYPQNIISKFKDIVFTIKFDFSAPVFIQRKIILQENTILELESANSYSIEYWLKEFVYPIRNYLNLATSFLSFIDKINAYCENFKNSIEVYYSQKKIDIERPSQIFPDNYLFTLEDLPNFGRTISKWLVFYKKYTSVCNLYFNIIYSPELDVKNIFLNLIQAIEIYHRTKYVNHKNWSDVEFKRRKRRNSEWFHWEKEIVVETSYEIFE